MSSFLPVLMALLAAANVWAQPAFDPLAGLTRIEAAPVSLTLVSCNLYCGGAYTERGKKTTWRTNENFAKLLAKDCPQAAVIGVQEAISQESVTRLQTNLQKHTNAKWEYAFETQGIDDRGSGLAVFWRPDRAVLDRRLGKTEIDRLDNGYLVRFMGVLLKEKASGRPFGVFTGKIAWDGARKGGHDLGEKDRVEEAKRLKGWVQRVMAGVPRAPRFLPMDMNSPAGSETYQEFARDYQSDGSKLATHNSLFRIFGRSIMRNKLDHIWYDADSGPRRTGGFLGAVVRSEHFGSDHRALWAKVRI
jgi:hypothetical protein